jgi:hypothetical protein
VTAILIALADVGPAMPLEELLVGAGFAAQWSAALAEGPRAGDVVPPATVVLLDADRLGARLPDVATAWRSHPAVPGLVALGNSSSAVEHAPRARVTLIAPTAKLATLIAAIHDAAKLRLAAGMRWDVMRAAVGLPPAADEPGAWQLTLVAARSVELEVPRAALRWHAAHYVTPTARLDELREDRLLTVPELEAAAVLDGTRTVQTHVAAGPLDPAHTARFLWTLASIGAVELTAEVRDVATVQRRLLAELRGHVRARAAMLGQSTFYDVLEITPLAEHDEIEAAVRLVGMRFSPQALAGHDLAELAGHVKTMWDLVEKARGVLLDHASRGRYHDWLRQRADLRTVWAIDPPRVQAAAEAFARGQRALGTGDVHKAMSELAVACRQFPGHPDYEANLAWARYRVQVASGRDRLAAGAAERKTIEELLVGRRPWPRALVALALLCAAGGDPDSARWHLHTALAVDPTLPAAVQLAQRLGMRR